MKFFENYFEDTDFYGQGTAEVQVLCPFHSDTNPSASINVENSLFHCWVCGVGYNEQQFISKINDISLVDAGKVLSNLEGTTTTDWSLVNIAELWSDQDMLNALTGLRLEKDFIEEMKLGKVYDKLGKPRLGIPVFYNKVLIDVRAYDLMRNSSVKMISEMNAENGYIIPYDIWQKEDKSKVTYIFEGEKDMLVARSMGLNAITLTGGADALPNDMVLNSFKDRDFILCYDNDDAGRQGMKDLYFYIKNIANKVEYINIADVVKENKEDFTDAVFKYDMDIWTFYSLEVRSFSGVKKTYTTLETALNSNLIKKNLLSQITISGEFEDTFAVPTMVTFTKKDDSDKNATMVQDEKKTWYLEKSNIHQLLNLIESDAKKSQVIQKIMGFCGIPAKEQNLEINISEYITVFKSKAMDIMGDKDVEVDEENSSKKQLDIYSFTKLNVGEIYEVIYKLYPHPTKHQKLVVVASHVENRNLDDFEVAAVVEHLKKFQFKGTIKEKLSHLYESAKHYVAKHLDYKLWLMSDLVFNSVLEFDYEDRIRGALDIFILGDTQVGKSETTGKLVDLYNFGHFLSLKTSTTIGLIGGSTKVDNNWLNTIGAIPRQHKKLVVMEEFSGAKPDFIKTMTDIRSSGWLRIVRSAGELSVPCRLRMITLSNAIEDSDGNPRHLSSFPNGVMPLMELIKSSEDVARYDGFFLMPKPEKRFNPFGFKLTDNPIPAEAYPYKAEWVYTRKPEDVRFETGVESYIWEKAEKLNELFECNFPLFGTTTSQKLARFSVAMAALLVNTDETMEKIIVSKSIVDEVFDFLVSIYDNEVFKLREYKEEYDSYSKTNKKELKEIQEIYSKNSTLFEWINNSSSASRNDLRTISGLDGDSFNPLFNRMVALKLVRISGTKVFPTPKFRLSMRQIDKTIVMDTGQKMIDVKEDKHVNTLNTIVKGKE